MSLSKKRKQGILRLFIVLNILFVIVSANGYVASANGVMDVITPSDGQEEAMEVIPSTNIEEQSNEDEFSNFSLAKGASGFVTFTSSQELSYPQGIAVDSEGKVYAANSEFTGEWGAELSVKQFDNQGTYIQDFGETGYIANGIAVDDQNVFVYDDYGNIRKYDRAGKIVNTFDTHFYEGKGIAIDQQYIYVVNSGADKKNIEKYNREDGTLIQSWGNDIDNVSDPSAIAVDHNFVYVSDRASNEVIRFGKDGSSPAVIVKGLDSPRGLAVDDAGHIYVVETNQVKKFANDGTHLNTWGNGYGSEEGQFKYPKGIALDKQGNIYVSDTENNRIQFLNPPPSVVGKEAKAGVIDNTNPAHSTVAYTIDIKFSENVFLDASGTITLSDGVGNVNMDVQILNGNVLEVKSIGGLKSNHPYTLTIPRNVIKDSGGSTLESDIVYPFKTPDVTPPTVISTTPLNQAENVTIDKKINITFSKSIQPSDNFGRIKLEDTTDRKSVSIQTNTDQNTLTLTHPDLLAYSTVYKVTIPANAVKDTVGIGNPLIKEYTFEFTTTKQDITSPTITATSPRDAAKNVAVEVEFEATFSENIQQGDHFGMITLKSNETEVGMTASVKDNGILNIKPNKPLNHGSVFIVTIPVGAVKDIAGNHSAVGHTSTFTTIERDVTSPTIITTNPIADDQGVAINKEIEITFSENIQLDAAKSIMLKKSAGVATIIQSSLKANDPTTVVLKPKDTLDYLTKYEVTIPAGAVSDESGNQLEAPLVLSFKTQSNPSTGISHYKEIPMPGNSRFEGLAVDRWGNAYSTSYENNVFGVKKFDQDGKLVNTLTGFRYPGRLVIDNLGNLYVHDLDRVKKFDKEGKDVQTFTIEDSSGGIALDQTGNIYITNTSNHTIVKYSNAGVKLATWGTQGSAEGQFNRPVSIDVDKDGFIFVADRENKRIQKLDPSGIFVTSWGVSEADYYWGPSPIDVSVDSFGSVYVVADNEKNLLLQYDNKGKFIRTIGKKKDAKDTTGGKVNEYISPTTATIDDSNNLYLLDNGKKRIQYIDMSPQIAQINESFNQADVGENAALNYTFELIFNEIVHDNKALNIKLLNDKNEPVAVTYQLEDNRLGIQAANLITDSKYKLVVPADVVKDSVGQTMDAEFLRIIHTLDTKVPFVERTNISKGIVNDIQSNILLSFNEAIHQGTDFDRITLQKSDESTVGVTGKIEGNVLTIKPNLSLEYDQTYTLTIPNKAIADQNGLNLVNDYSQTFKVVKADKIAPKITMTNPDQGMTGVQLDKEIVITFDEDIQAGDNFKIISILKGEKAIVIDRTINGNSLTLKPRSRLEQDMNYKVILPENAITDRTGNRMTQKYTFVFTTGKAIEAPYVESSTPVQNAAKVQLNSGIAITFSELIVEGNNLDQVKLAHNGVVVDTESSISRNTLTIQPKKALNYGTVYQLTIPQGAVMDTESIPLEYEYTLGFTTVNNNANLAYLELFGSKVVGEDFRVFPLYPSFRSDITSYTARLPYDISDFDAEVILEDEEAIADITITKQSADDVLILVTVTASDGVTSKVYRILATIDKKPTDGGESPGGSTGGGSGGSGSSTGGSALSLTLKEVNADKAISDALNSGKEVIISLSNDPDGKLQITSSSMKSLIDKKKSLVLQNGLVTVEFAPTSFGNTLADNSKLELGIRILKPGEKQTELKNAALGENVGLLDIGGVLVELIAQIVHVDGTKTPIKSFGEPVAITVNLSALQLSEADIAQLTGVRYVKDDKRNLTLVKLGGTYNTLNKSFTFYTDHFSLYGVIKAKSLTQIRLKFNELHTTVNGVKKSNDVAPIVVNDRTMVPARFIAENLGADVLWNEEAKEVTIKLDGKTLTLTVDKLIEGFDTAPKVVNDRVLVPIRYISEYFGANVLWYPSMETVEIVK